VGSSTSLRVKPTRPHELGRIPAVRKPAALTGKVIVDIHAVEFESSHARPPEAPDCGGFSTALKAEPPRRHHLGGVAGLFHARDAPLEPAIQGAPVLAGRE
jgi:hypothetical protein